MTTLNYNIIRSEYSPSVNADVLEIMMNEDCTVAELPTDNVAPSSIATAIVDGALVVYVYSADGAWEEVTI